MTLTNTERPLGDPLSAGQDALARGAWGEARASFEEALRQAETPEALEGLAMAAWWLSDATAMFDARESAYKLFRERGDRQGAARVATLLALDYNDFRGEPAIAKGWIQRARRLLEGLDPAPEHGWLAIWEGLWALPDTTTAQRLGAEAAALGCSLGVIDLEMAGLALEGLALVSEGKIAEGMPRLDEATAAAVAGELTDLAVMGVVCCFLIYGCELVRDYDRAAQWCDRVKEICERWHIRHLFGVCRTHYSSVLMWRGAWAEAEAELATATEELKATRPAMAVEGIVRLAELRRRQGRFQEAAMLFSQVEFHALAQLGRAALALDQADPVAAADLAERFLRHIPPEDRTERAAGLEVLVRAQIAQGDREQAGTSLAELQSVTAAIGTEPMRASCRHAEGIVAAADGDHNTARRRFEDAVDLFDRSGAPFETARARIELARSLCALGRCDVSEQEARAALHSLQEMGAAWEVENAATLLRELESMRGGRPSGTPDLTGLTPRELEVLRLVAQGLSNQEIATRLVVSQHTVHRHVSNILTKLDLSSRAAAVAYAGRLGLL